METKDLNHAAYLMAKGQDLKDSKPDNDNRFWFIFEDTEKINELSKEYYLNSGLVNPQHFINQQKTLKNLIRNYKI